MVDPGSVTDEPVQFSKLQFEKVRIEEIQQP